MKTPPYPCIFVATVEEKAEALSYELQDLGAEAIEWRDNSTMTKSDSALTEFIAGFPTVTLRDTALEKLKALAEEGVIIRSQDVEDDGWSTRWREFFKPVVLKRIQVVTPWMDLPQSDLIPVVIDPAQAFGTGGHATTKLVLNILEQWAIACKMPEAILDVGTGSGVLAVAACKLGCAHVTGIDIDPEAVDAAKKNARQNGVAQQTEFIHCETRDLTSDWELILANIELGIFKKCAFHIASRIRDGGSVILSGILEDQIEEAISLWPDFTQTKTEVQDGWAALELVKKA